MPAVAAIAAAAVWILFDADAILKYLLCTFFLQLLLRNDEQCTKQSSMLGTGMRIQMKSKDGASRHTKWRKRVVGSPNLAIRDAVGKQRAR